MNFHYRYLLVKASSGRPHLSEKEDQEFNSFGGLFKLDLVVSLFYKFSRDVGFLVPVAT
jgi:hypothetical protein